MKQVIVHGTDSFFQKRKHEKKNIFVHALSMSSYASCKTVEHTIPLLRHTPKGLFPIHGAPKENKSLKPYLVGLLMSFVQTDCETVH